MDRTPGTIAAETDSDAEFPLDITIPGDTGAPTAVYSGLAKVDSTGAVRPYNEETGTLGTFEHHFRGYTMSSQPRSRGDKRMVMGTGAVKSSWIGLPIAVGTMAIVSVFAVVQEWDFGSWVWAAAVCAVMGIFSSIEQVRRNRRLDSAARQAQEIGNGPDVENGSR